MDFKQISQINAGCIITGKKPVQAYSPQDFYPPFDDVVSYMQKHPDWTKEELYINFAPQELDQAIASVKSLNGSAESVDWRSNLLKLRTEFEVGMFLEKTGRNAQNGRGLDVLEVSTQLKSIEMNESAGMMNAADIDLDSVVHLQPSGWREFDIAFGGMPVTGIMTMLGATGTGKSYWTAKFVDKYLSHYINNKVAIFCQEMPEDRYLKRSIDMYPTPRQHIKDRKITITRKARSIEKMISLISAEPPGLVIIDGMDTLYEGDDGQASTAKAEAVWKKTIEMGVLLKVPIICTVQPNRAGKLAVDDGKFINMYHIERTGAAENASEQVIGLQHLPRNASFNWVDQSYPVYDNAYYMIGLKQRNNTKLGALIIKDSETMWSGEPIGKKVDGKIVPTLFKRGAGAELGKKSKNG